MIYSFVFVCAVISVHIQKQENITITDAAVACWIQNIVLNQRSLQIQVLRYRKIDSN